MNGVWRNRRKIPIILYYPLIYPQFLLGKSYYGGKVKYLSMTNTFAIKMQMSHYLVVRKIIYYVTKVFDKQMRISPVAGMPNNLKIYFSHGESFQHVVMLRHSTLASSPCSPVNPKVTSHKGASSSQNLVGPTSNMTTDQDKAGNHIS